MTELDYQHKPPTNPPAVGHIFHILVTEAAELEAKGAVEEVEPEKGEYVSSYFSVPKPRSPGKYRSILNLKWFNKTIKNTNFAWRV